MPESVNWYSFIDLCLLTWDRDLLCSPSWHWTHGDPLRPARVFFVVVVLSGRISYYRIVESKSFIYEIQFVDLVYKPILNKIILLKSRKYKSWAPDCTKCVEGAEALKRPESCIRCRCRRSTVHDTAELCVRRPKGLRGQERSGPMTKGSCG